MEQIHIPLRLVAPDEKVPEAPVVVPLPPSTLSEPIKEQISFVKTVEDFDPSVPLRAAYLICDGCYLADSAISFYHSAVAHAPVGTFRHDVPPGLKSAEATRAWLGTHLTALKAIIPDDSVSTYTRGKELKQAATLAATELQRAHATARDVGMNFDDRYATALKDATTDLLAVRDFVGCPKKNGEDTYSLGAFVLGNSL